MPSKVDFASLSRKKRFLKNHVFSHSKTGSKDTSEKEFVKSIKQFAIKDIP